MRWYEIAARSNTRRTASIDEPSTRKKHVSSLGRAIQDRTSTHPDPDRNADAALRNWDTVAVTSRGLVKGR